MKRIALVSMLAAAITAATPAIAASQSDPAEQYAAEAGRVPVPLLIERYGADDVRSGSLRLPKGKEPFPVIVMIHGGCWTKGYSQRRDMEAVGAALAGRGFAVWNIEYRQVGDAGAPYPGMFEDIAAGVDHLAALAKRYPIDLGRVAVLGHSAGAHLALWAAARERIGGRWTSTIVHPKTVIAIDGPGDLAPFVGADAQVCGRPVIVPLMGGTPDAVPDNYTAGSPARHLPLGVRTLLVEGALGDAVKPYAAAARAAGDTVISLAPPGATHFDIVTPATPNGKAVIDFIAAQAFATPGAR